MSYPGWTELIDDSLPGTSDSAGAARVRRYFRVMGYSRQQIYQDPTLITDETNGALPALGTSFITPNIVLDSYDVQPSGLDFIATANYSTDGAYTSFSGPNFTEAQWQVTFSIGLARFPIGQKYVTKLATTGGLVITNNSHKFPDQAAEVTQVRYQRSVDIPLAQVGNMLDALALENGKLHYIRGKLYRFIASEARPITTSKWRTTYTWVYDPGIRSADFAATASSAEALPYIPSGLSMPGASISPYNLPVWTLPPYCSVVLSDNFTVYGPDQYPVIDTAVIRRYGINLLGWQNLPEVGIL